MSYLWSNILVHHVISVKRHRIDYAVCLHRVPSMWFLCELNAYVEDNAVAENVVYVYALEETSNLPVSMPSVVEVAVYGKL